MVYICRVLSAGVPAAFAAFILYAASVGMTKQTLYAGPVGYWLGIYLGFAMVATTACVVAISWLAFTRQPAWRAASRDLALAWVITVLAYAMWSVAARPI